MSSVQSAEKTLDKANGELAKWQEKLQEAKAEQAALAERNAEAEVTPGQATKVFADQDQAEQRQLGVVEKIESRVSKAAEKVAAAERDLIAAHVDTEQEAADAARKVWTDHEAERDRLKAALEEHDGVPYRPEPLRGLDPDPGRRAEYKPTTATDRLQQAWISAKARVAAIKFYLETGELATKVSATGDSAGRWPATGRVLKPHERPEVIYGERSTAGEPRSRVPFAGLRFGPDNRTLSGKRPGKPGYPTGQKTEEEAKVMDL